MTEARCSCGALTLTLTDAPKLVVACHCLDCQRRTGAPFGVGAFYAADSVTVSGGTTEYARPGSSGGSVRNAFCPTCGSTVFWRAERLPGMIGVAVGALAAPDHAPPARSIYERTKHEWVRIEGAVEHLQGGAGARAAD